MLSNAKAAPCTDSVVKHLILSSSPNLRPFSGPQHFHDLSLFDPQTLYVCFTPILLVYLSFALCDIYVSYVSLGLQVLQSEGRSQVYWP